jgi:hypothetical protein
MTGGRRSLGNLGLGGGAVEPVVTTMALLQLGVEGEGGVWVTWALGGGAVEPVVTTMALLQLGVEGDGVSVCFFAACVGR